MELYKEQDNKMGENYRNIILGYNPIENSWFNTVYILVGYIIPNMDSYCIPVNVSRFVIPCAEKEQVILLLVMVNII